MDSAAAIWTPKLIVPCGPFMPGEAIEEFFGAFDADVVKHLKKVLKTGDLKDRILMMSGSVGNYALKAMHDLLLGKTAYAGETTIYAGLWSAAVDDTSHGATTGESAYGSYARHSLTNNTTNFAAGTGTSAYTKQLPSDATHSWATSTATGTNNTITYLFFLNGNAGTSADKNVMWCSVTSTIINSGDTPQMATNAVSVVAG